MTKMSQNNAYKTILQNTSGETNKPKASFTLAIFNRFLSSRDSFAIDFQIGSNTALFLILSQTNQRRLEKSQVWTGPNTELCTVHLQKPLTQHWTFVCIKLNFVWSSRENAYLCKFPISSGNVSILLAPR